MGLRHAVVADSDDAQAVLGVIPLRVALGGDDQAATGAVEKVLGDAARRHRADVRMVRGPERDEVGLTALRERLERVGGRALLDVDDVELPAVPLDDALGEDEGILAALVLLVSGDDLRVQRLIRHRVVLRLAPDSSIFQWRHSSSW